MPFSFNKLEIIAETRLSYEQGKLILKCYWKLKNVPNNRTSAGESFKQIHLHDLTVDRTIGKVEVDGTVQKQRSGKQRSSTKNANNLRKKKGC